MYANILLSTDGSDVARKGVKHGVGLAKALNAKVIVITVTEPQEVDYGGGHASGWIPSHVSQLQAVAEKNLDEVRRLFDFARCWKRLADAADRQRDQAAA